jgi:hypothetical protein
MRFRGGGVGHKSTRDATKCVYEDRDVMDANDYNSESGESDITDSEEAMSVDQSTSDESESSGSNESDSESSDQSSDDSEAYPLEDHKVDGFADY